MAAHRARIRKHAENVTGKQFDSLTAAELREAGRPSNGANSRGAYRRLLEIKEKHESDTAKKQKMHAVYAAWEAAGTPADMVQLIDGVVVGLRMEGK